MDERQVGLYRQRQSQMPFQALGDRCSVWSCQAPDRCNEPGIDRGDLARSNDTGVDSPADAGSSTATSSGQPACRALVIIRSQTMPKVSVAAGVAMARPGRTLPAAVSACGKAMRTTSRTCLPRDGATARGAVTGFQSPPDLRPMTTPKTWHTDFPTDRAMGPHALAPSSGSPGHLQSRMRSRPPPKRQERRGRTAGLWSGTCWSIC